MHVLFTNVRKRYDSGFTLEIDHLEIGPGERIGLVGNNGAGKTTMLRLMLGLLRFGQGDILVEGDSVQAFSLSWRSRSASHLDESSLIPFLSPQEFWQFVGDVYGIDREEQHRRLRCYDGFVEQAEGPRSKKKYIRDHSQGNRKKIGLVAAMMVQPQLLVLDEPFTNLDPGSRALLKSMLLQLNADHGTTLIVSSHDLEHVMEISSRMLLIQAGRIVWDNPASPEMLEDVRERLTNEYLDRINAMEPVG